MTEEEKREALILAESLGPVQIFETLQDLIARERELLERPMGSEIRAITLHNIAVLTAACAGYETAASRFEEASAQAKQACDDGKSHGVDEDP